MYICFHTICVVLWHYLISTLLYFLESECFYRRWSSEAVLMAVWLTWFWASPITYNVATLAKSFAFMDVDDPVVVVSRLSLVKCSDQSLCRLPESVVLVRKQSAAPLSSRPCSGQVPRRPHWTFGRETAAAKCAALRNKCLSWSQLGRRKPGWKTIECFENSPPIPLHRRAMHSDGIELTRLLSDVSAAMETGEPFVSICRWNLACISLYFFYGLGLYVFCACWRRPELILALSAFLY